jgi:hypothetical protein
LYVNIELESVDSTSLEAQILHFSYNCSVSVIPSAYLIVLELLITKTSDFALFARVTRLSSSRTRTHITPLILHNSKLYISQGYGNKMRLNLSINTDKAEEMSIFHGDFWGRIAGRSDLKPRREGLAATGIWRC